MLYCHFYQWKIESLCHLDLFFFLIALPRLYAQEKGLSAFNLFRKRFFRLSKKGVEFNVMETVMGGYFFCISLSVLIILVKNLSITNSHHLFLVLSQVLNSSVAFDANFLDIFFSSLLRFSENCHS